jgi:hypothetical protein
MDFIERWFHIFPDSGSGTTEVLYVVATAALVILLSCHRVTAFTNRWADRIWKAR